MTVTEFLGMAKQFGNWRITRNNLIRRRGKCPGEVVFGCSTKMVAASIILREFGWSTGRAIINAADNGELHTGEGGHEIRKEMESWCK